MNKELKDVLEAVFDSIDLGKKAVAGQNVVRLLPDIYEVMMDLPEAAKNFNLIDDEIKKALPGSPEEADIVAFVKAKFAQDVSSDAHAAAIVEASLKVLSSVFALVLAVKAVSEPVAGPV